MLVRSAQASSTIGPPHLVLYDGVCGLCHGVVRFVLTRDHNRLFAFAPLQGSTAGPLLARFGRDPTVLTTLYVVADYRSERGRVLEQSTAALFIAGQLGGPWKVASLARALPLPIRDHAYGLIARHRYRLAGRSAECVLPSAAFRDRFVGVAARKS